MAEKRIAKKQEARLEGLVAELHRSLSPGAIIRQDVRERGRRSNVMRQLDIVIEGVAGAAPVKLVIAHKRYTGPIDANRVTSYADLLQDVGADMGVMVSASPFTKGAADVAAESGITLLRWSEAPTHHWPQYFTNTGATEGRP